MENQENSLLQGVQARSTIDYALRTARQNQMQFNMMADAKAYIMITISSIVFSVVLSQLDRETFLLPFATLGFFSARLLSARPPVCSLPCSLSAWLSFFLSHAHISEFSKN